MQGLHKQSIRHFSKIAAIVLLAALTTLTPIYSQAEQDAVLMQAENKIRQADYKAAYQLLEPLENTRAGDIHYDYLLGIAGVESGNVTRGAFALERVLALTLIIKKRGQRWPRRIFYWAKKKPLSKNLIMY